MSVVSHHINQQRHQAYEPELDERVLGHLVVGHWFTELVDLLQQELSDLLHRLAADKHCQPHVITTQRQLAAHAHARHVVCQADSAGMRVSFMNTRPHFHVQRKLTVARHWRHHITTQSDSQSSRHQ